MESVWHIDYLQVLIRIFLAIIMGGAIGFEREKSNHPAGFRTHILVSIGSTLIMLISIYGFSDFLDDENVRFDPSRIAAQVVTGIGFLGAGTILRHGFSVTGLTTAASLWVVAAIGLAIGSGFYFGAIISTLFVLISLAYFSKLESLVVRKRQLIELSISVEDRPGKLGEVATKLGENKINIKNINIVDDDQAAKLPLVTIRLIVQVFDYDNVPHIVDEIKQINGVKQVQFGKNTD